MPGENLPPAGRSLFDYLVTVQDGDRMVYQVPFPFSALTKKIDDQLDTERSGLPPLKQVLIPMGRSLQRSAASPEFFKYPRVVAAVDGEPRAQPGHTGMLLKDRLYLGYQEKANIIEVISYNEAAGRFEFQVVKDYRLNGSPRVAYANRTLCTACHQNAGPIFARPLWDETNANPQIAKLLTDERRDFFGIPVDRGVDIPNAIDDATDRANLFSVYQVLWQQGCGQNDATAIRCRAALLTLALRYRLSGKRELDRHSHEYREYLLGVVADRWRAQWPDGLFIPNPDIPNRNPFHSPLVTGGGESSLPTATSAESTRAGNLLPALAGVPSQFEPLQPRLPLETWSTPSEVTLDRIIAGLSEFIAATDIRRLDEHLFSRGSLPSNARLSYQGECEFIRKPANASAYRISARCRHPDNVDAKAFAMAGRIYISGDRATGGTIESLSISNDDELHDLTVSGGAVAAQGADSAVTLSLALGDLHARRADGSAIENLTLHWPDPVHAASPQPGTAVLTVVDDYAPVRVAIAEMAAQTQSGSLDAFSSKPFRRASVIPALFARLGIDAGEWCCIDDARMPVAALDAEQPDLAIERAEAIHGPLKNFYQFCAKCHQTTERFPPNFLAGGPDQVATNVAHCAERIYFRLSMWQVAEDARPKTPMPPIHALHGLRSDPARWRDSQELVELKGHVADILESQTGKAPQLEEFVRRGFENLRECLPAHG